MSIAILSEVIRDAEAEFLRPHIQLLPAVPMTQDQFYELCQQNPAWRFERNARGELIIMPPSGGGSGRRNLSVGAQLYNWAEADGSGEAYDSSAGFVLPNGANRSPDTAWVLKTRLAGLTDEEKEKFIPLCPDFLVEMLSPSDSLKRTQAKMEEYIANGTKLGWMIVPEKKQVHVYRPGQPVQILDNPQTLAGDPELPGFVLDLEPVWRP
jgi:Uma2 family endonuclease